MSSSLPRRLPSTAPCPPLPEFSAGLSKPACLSIRGLACACERAGCVPATERWCSKAPRLAPCPPAGSALVCRPCRARSCQPPAHQRPPRPPGAPCLGIPLHLASNDIWFHSFYTHLPACLTTGRAPRFPLNPRHRPPQQSPAVSEERPPSRFPSRQLPLKKTEQYNTLLPPATAA